MPRSIFDADHNIEKSINQLCRELDRTYADDPKFLPTVEAIAKLRASLNAPVCEKTED